MGNYLALRLKERRAEPDESVLICRTHGLAGGVHGQNRNADVRGGHGQQGRGHGGNDIQDAAVHDAAEIAVRPPQIRKVFHLGNKPDVRLLFDRLSWKIADEIERAEVNQIHKAAQAEDPGIALGEGELRRIEQRLDGKRRA